MKLRELDRLRAFAVYLTVYHHMVGLRADLYSFWGLCWSGVDLFFVISGFLVGDSLLRSLPDLSKVSTFVERLAVSRKAILAFWIRRFFRIAPVAIAGVILTWCFTLGYNRGGAFPVAQALSLETLAILTSTYNYALQLGMQGSLLHYWSLSAEAHFYILLPVFALTFRNVNQRIVATLVGIALVAFVVRPNSTMTPRMITHTRLDGFLFGMLLAQARQLGWGRSLAGMNRSAGVAIATLMLILIPWAPNVMPSQMHDRVGVLVIALASSVLVWLASLDRGYVLDIPGLRRVLEYVGTRSYSIYVLHYPVLWAILEWKKQNYGERFEDRALTLNQPLDFWVVSWVAILFLSELSYRLIERPMIRRTREQTDAPRLPAPSISSEAA